MKDLLLTWLNSAYALEKSQIKSYHRYIDDFKEHEDIKIKLYEHIEDSERHADLVKEHIERLGGRLSAIKTTIGSALGSMQGISTSVFDDGLIKDILMIHAGEHFEHGTYIAIKTLAENLGEIDLATTANEIASEEKDMADWALDQITVLVNDVALEKSFA